MALAHQLAFDRYFIHLRYLFSPNDGSGTKSTVENKHRYDQRKVAMTLRDPSLIHNDFLPVILYGI